MEKIYQDFDIVELATQSMVKPDDFGWWGKEEMFVSWGWAGIDKHNASDSLEISNFDFITKDLMTRFPDDFEIVGLRHWAVGHVDRLTCKVLINEKSGVVEDNITEAFRAAIEWLIDLSEYPVANDDAWSEYCVEETIETIEAWIPEQIYVAESKRMTAEVLYSEIVQFEDFDFDSSYITENVVLYAAYESGLCDANYQDFWNEWTEQEGLPSIVWGDNFGISQIKLLQSEGQLSLFDEDGNNG